MDARVKPAHDDVWVPSAQRAQKSAKKLFVVIAGLDPAIHEAVAY